MKKDMDTKKVRSAIASMNELEFILLEHHVSMRRAIMDVTRSGELTPDDVCAAFGIKPSQYKRFTTGDYNYTLSDVAHLHALMDKVAQNKTNSTAP